VPSSSTSPTKPAESSPLPIPKNVDGASQGQERERLRADNEQLEAALGKLSQERDALQVELVRPVSGSADDPRRSADSVMTATGGGSLCADAGPCPAREPSRQPFARTRDRPLEGRAVSVFLALRIGSFVAYPTLACVTKTSDGGQSDGGGDGPRQADRNGREHDEARELAVVRQRARRLAVSDPDP
jgi:hypothetical protein